MEQTKTLGQWLVERCEQENLSLREAAAKTGLSHATIRDVMNNGRASAETIRKLAHAFGGDGNERLALEDLLLVLAGYRTPRDDRTELSQPLARLMDLVAEFSEPQLKMMARFAQFLGEMEKE